MRASNHSWKLMLHIVEDSASTTINNSSCCGRLFVRFHDHQPQLRYETHHDHRASSHRHTELSQPALIDGYGAYLTKAQPGVRLVAKAGPQILPQESCGEFDWVRYSCSPFPA